MTANPDPRKKSEPEPTIVVAGDVCIDWLSIQVEPVTVEDCNTTAANNNASGVKMVNAVAANREANPTNWELRGGRHMYAVRGGAWLTADFTKSAVNGKAVVCKPEDLGDLSSIPPDQIIHSMLMLRGFPCERDNKTRVWRVGEYEGFAGPADGKPSQQPRAHCDDPNVAIVVLDDAGNGFRDEPDLWPEALGADRKPIIIYKVRRPLLKGPLWERLCASHLDRTIAVLNANELREDGAPISRHLSWERTATDLVLALEHDPNWEPLKQCAQIIVPLGLEGVVHLSHPNGNAAAHLWYVPNLIENDLSHSSQGAMAGLSSAFVAAFTAQLVAQPQEDRLGLQGSQAGIKKGIVASRYLLEQAFGNCADEKGHPAEPGYPAEGIFGREDFADFVIYDLDLPLIPRRSDPASIRKFRDWRILDSLRDRPIRELASDIAGRGLDKAMPKLPAAKFGGLETIDRWEIESYRSIRNLIREFLKNPKPERPLCLAVFGRPGSGKSYGVTQVALSVGEKGVIEKLDFNLSHWESPRNLASALHRVRDSVLRGKVPLVFFDEFDSKFGGIGLGWLKYFLAPMQDGVFSDENFTHLIGRAIFVFAGGTRPSFREFRELAQLQEPDVKAQDFLSRLRGHVDVYGADPLVDATILRRAMILRSLLHRKFQSLFDGNGKLRIHPSVLVSFLNVPEYCHGIRSIEALLEMSQLQGRDEFDPSLLPPLEQLQLHADGEAFWRTVQSPVLLGEVLDVLAKSIHKRYVAREMENAKSESAKEKIRTNKSGQDWDNLDQILRDSNREQAAHIPVKLAAIDCDLAPIGDGLELGGFEFTRKEIEQLAEMEHERWMEERRLRQPNHPALIPWNQLTDPVKRKDIDAIRDMPAVLEDAKLRIVTRVDRNPPPPSPETQVI